MYLSTSKCDLPIIRAYTRLFNQSESFKNERRKHKIMLEILNRIGPGAWCIRSVEATDQYVLIAPPIHPN